MTRTLIFTQIHATEGRTAQHSNATQAVDRLLFMALTLACRLNPDADILVIDNASTVPFALPDGPWQTQILEAGPVPRIRSQHSVMRFEKAIGHFHFNYYDDPPPRDGPGRAIMTGLQAALDGNYDRVMYMEGDALAARPAEYFFAQMDQPVASCARTPMGYLDWNLFFVRDMVWFKQFDFIGKYNWQERHLGETEGERFYETLFGDALQVLPTTGGRGEPQKLNIWQGQTNLAAAFPAGCDYFTHGKKDDFAMFLDINGFGELKNLL